MVKYFWAPSKNGVSISVGARRRVRLVERTNRLLRGIRSNLVPCVGPKIDAGRVSHVKRRVVHSLKYVPGFLGCKKFPTSFYVDLGSRMIRKVPSRRGVVRRKSLMGVSTNLVCGKCRSSTTEACTINRISPRTHGLVSIAERYFFRKLGTTHTKGRLGSVSGTVNTRTTGCRCKVIHSLIKRKVNARLRRSPRVPGFPRGQEKIHLVPNVALTMRPVVGLKHTSIT